MKVADLFNKISKTAGAVDKAALLKPEISNLIKQIYEDTYDNSRKYFVKKFDMPNKFGKKTIENDYSEFHDVLNILANREITGNDAIELVENKISEFIEKDAEILARILDRNLKIGISFDSFNKLLGKNAKKKFEVTLAYNLDKVKGVNPIDGTYYASRKCDGCVSGDTIVEFENGIKMPISEVVKNRMKGKIKSYDERTKTIVYNEIEDWMYNVSDINPSQKQWYEIELEDGKKLKITGNDSLYVEGKGWVNVEKLAENDKIIIN